jgi:hypothetical protein
MTIPKSGYVGDVRPTEAPRQEQGSAIAYACARASGLPAYLTRGFMEQSPQVYHFTSSADLTAEAEHCPGKDRP